MNNRSLLKLTLDYMFNTLFIAALSIFLYVIFKINIFDTLFFSGIGFIITSFIFYSNERSCKLSYAQSPISHQLSDVGTDIANNNNIFNMEAEKLELDIRRTNNKNTVLLQNSLSLKALLFEKTALSTLMYGIIIVCIGLIKYYKYF